MKLFFIVGENSGDVLGARLIAAMKKKYGDSVECMGVGGPLMKQAGFNELLPMDQISVIGIWEVLPKLGRLLKINKAIVEEIEKRQPDAVITVDFPDFNFIAAKSLKQRGIYKGKIIHYVAPSVWAWRPGRAKNMATFMDGVICLFPMEVKHFTEVGLKACHVGHPVVTSNAKTALGDDFRRENDIPLEQKTVGLFFGSRESEFKNLSEIMKQAVALVNDYVEEVHVIVPTLPDLEYNIQKIIEGYPLKTYISANPNVKWEAIKACDVAIAVSGTIALELAYAGVPHVVGYKANAMTATIVRALAKIDHVHLANILLEDDVVPEYLQGQCTVENLAEGLTELLQSEEKRNLQKEKFLALDSMLKGAKDTAPAEQAADFVVEIVKS